MTIPRDGGAWTSGSWEGYLFEAMDRFLEQAVPWFTVIFAVSATVAFLSTWSLQPWMLALVTVAHLLALGKVLEGSLEVQDHHRMQALRTVLLTLVTSYLLNWIWYTFRREAHSDYGDPVDTELPVRKEVAEKLAPEFREQLNRTYRQQVLLQSVLGGIGWSLWIVVFVFGQRGFALLLQGTGLLVAAAFTLAGLLAFVLSGGPWRRPGFPDYSMFLGSLVLGIVLYIFYAFVVGYRSLDLRDVIGSIHRIRILAFVYRYVSTLLGASILLLGGLVLGYRKHMQKMDAPPQLDPDRLYQKPLALDSLRMLVGSAAILTCFLLGLFFFKSMVNSP